MSRNKGRFVKGHVENTGENHPNYGKHLSDEHKQNISKSHMGKNPTFGMLGKNHSDKTKTKISDSKKGISVNVGKNNPMYGNISHAMRIGRMGNYKRYKINKSKGIKRKYYEMIYYIKTKLRSW